MTVTPDALIDDPESKVFYILKNETVAICKTPNDLPYHKNRASYLSCGRFSPKHRKVVFWPDPINPHRAMQLLKDNLHIEDDYTYIVSGGGVVVKGAPKRSDNPVDKLDGVKKRSVEVLLDKGMRIQGADQGQQEEPPTSGD